MLNDFLLNLAANLTCDLLKAAATRLRDAAFGDAQQQALQRACQRAFEAMFGQIVANLDPAMQTHLGDLLGQFVASKEVANRLLDLALTGQPLPMAELRRRFEGLGFDPTTLPVDFDAAMTAFVEALAQALRDEAMEPDSPLYNRVSLGRLDALHIEQQGQRTLLERVLDGQSEAASQLGAQLVRLEGQLQEVRSLLTELVRAGGSRGVAVGGDVTSSVIVTGDRNIVLADGGRLARWWEEIGPDPQALLSEYLRRVADAFAPLRFPLGHLPKPIPLDEVYLDLPIVRAPTEEALLRPRRPGQRLSGESILQAGELLKRHQRSALVGILGMGKTTTLRYLTWLYAARPEHRLYWGRRELVPFYASIADLAELWSPDKRAAGPEGLVEAFAEAIARALGGAFGARNVARIFRFVLDQGKALVLLDALDEFQASNQERLGFVEALQAVWDAPPFKDNRLLMTSRPYRFLNPRGFAQYALQTPEGEMDRLIDRLGRAVLRARYETMPDEDVEAWVEQLGVAIRSPRLREFWTPFYVTLMVYLGTGTDSAQEGVSLLDAIGGLADLYRYFLIKTIEWESAKGNRPEIPEDKAILALGYLAYDSFVERVRDPAADRIGNAIGISLGEAAAIRRFWLGTGLIYQDELRRHQGFNYAGFQAFGVAAALADMSRRGQQGQVTELLGRYAWDPEWELVRQLYIALA